MLTWWKARKARRAALAALERDGAVGLMMAMQRLDEATAQQARENGVGIEHVTERVTAATDEAISILEDAVDQPTQH